MKYISYVDAFIKGLEKPIEEALTAMGEILVSEAKARCKVDTNRLRDSIEYEVNKDTLRVGTNVEYAPFVELGTSKMAARPFLRPALLENKQALEKAFNITISNITTRGK
jgi:HK97 gp10 family phage protein